ncbi:MAG: hypothetical protein ACK51L_04820 [bacterium]
MLSYNYDESSKISTASTTNDSSGYLVLLQLLLSKSHLTYPVTSALAYGRHHWWESHKDL